MLRQGFARRAMAAAAGSRSPIVTAAELKTSTESPRVFEVTWFPGTSLFAHAAAHCTAHVTG